VRLLLPAEEDGGDLVAARVRGWSLTPLAAAWILTGLDAKSGRGPGASAEGIGASVACWARAARLALELVGRGRIAPRWLPAGQGPVGEDRFEAVWVVSADLPGDRRRLEALGRALPPAARAAAREPSVGAGSEGTGGEEAGSRAPEDRPAGEAESEARGDERFGTADLWPGEVLAREFADDVADAVVRASVSGLDLDLLAEPLVGAEEWQDKWLGALLRAREDAGLRVLEREAHLPRELERWVGPLREEGEADVRGCVVLRAPEEPGQEWRVELALQARDDPSLRVPAARVSEAGRSTLEVEGRVFRRVRACLRRAARKAAGAHPSLEPLAEAPYEAVELEAGQAADLLDRGLPALRRSGLGVVCPGDLNEAPTPGLRLRLEAAEPDADEDGEPGVGFGLADLLRFSWEVAVGEETIPAEEFGRMVEEGRVLVRRKEGWLFLGGEAVGEVVRRIAEPPGSGAAGAAKVAAGLAGAAELEGGGEVSVVVEPAVQRLLEALEEGPGEAPRGDGGDGGDGGGAPEGFVGELRPYQLRGIQWLAALGRHGLGGILADEMGLGKTIQAIGLLLLRHGGDGGRPSVVVCPASVLGNWQHELARFAPELPVHRHHGQERPRTSEALAEAASGGVAVTTYGTFHRDADLFASLRWRLALLDEAQKIKNPDAGRARAARRLPADQRVALTGTPVENRLDELWSISEFVNPGLLGPRRRFERRIARPVERDGDPRATERLRRIVGPFVLRRVKAEVAPELPERVEMNVHCTLTGEQAALYEAVIGESLEEVRGATGMTRRGRVLALLTRLKQVVNHPAHYLGEEEPLPGRSGKLDRLTEMLQEVTDDGERALVFTQYRKMGDLVVAHLERTFGWDVPFLHGGVPPERRDRQVETFQDEEGPPAFVLSLRAGGTGLNLTGANHVIHYDRWWNPAVEDQATDRAHRIGQSRDVFVHRFVTLGTLEERIDELLERKRALADAVVPTGESWITELSDDELGELVALDAGTVVEGEA